RGHARGGGENQERRGEEQTHAALRGEAAIVGAGRPGITFLAPRPRAFPLTSSREFAITCPCPPSAPRVPPSRPSRPAVPRPRPRAPRPLRGPSGPARARAAPPR